MSPAPKPWTKLRERGSRDYRIFTTRTFDVADPRNGNEYVRTVIEAPDWVNVVPLTEDGRVIMVRQFRFGSWANELELPGGMVDPGEVPAAGVERELQEETGYRARTVELIGVCRPNPAIMNNRLHTFLARGCEFVGSTHQDSSEDIQVELIAVADLKRLVREGVVNHALVLAALLHWEWRV